MAETDVNAGASQPPDYADQIAAHETQGTSNPDTTGNSRSSALGRHQFLAGTWLGFAKANPGLFQGMSEQEILDKRTDPAFSKMGTDWYANYNSRILQQHGFQPTAANLALAHGFGGVGAAGLLGQPDTATLHDAIVATQGQDAATRIMAANPAYLNMTVGQMKGRYGGMSGEAPAAAVATAPAVAAPAAPTSGGLAANQSDPQLAQLQRLALLNRLMPAQQAAPNYAAAANNASPTGWANALLASGQQTSPLQTLQQIQAIRYLQQNGGSLLG